MDRTHKVDSQNGLAVHKVPSRVRTLQVLTLRELRGRLVSGWGLLLLSAVFSLAAVYGGGFLGTFETESVLVSVDPTMPLNTMVLFFLALVLGLRLSTSLSWEREHRTLEVILTGPAGHGEIAVSKFLAEAVFFVAILTGYCAYLLVATPMGQGTLELADLASIWSASLLMLPFLGLGLLISALNATVRGAVIGYLIVCLLLGLVEVLTLWLSVQEPQNLSLSMLYLRRGLETVSRVFYYVSPASYLSDLFRQMLDLSLLSVERLIEACALCVGLLALAIGISSRRGLS